MPFIPDNLIVRYVKSLYYNAFRNLRQNTFFCNNFLFWVKWNCSTLELEKFPMDL